MQSFFLITLSLFALGVVTEPIHAFTREVDLATRTAACMTDAQAQTVANNFRTLIADYSEEFTNETLTTDFVDYSDSVIELINNGCSGPVPLGTPTFTSRAEFIAGQSTQPPIDFQILKVWHNCDTVFLRWRSNQQPQIVTGIIVLETVAAYSGPQPRLIKTVYSEFNSGAWLVNLGVFVPTCSSNGNGDANATKLMVRYRG